MRIIILLKELNACLFSQKTVKFLLSLFIVGFSPYLMANTDTISSSLVNESNQNGFSGFKLVLENKTMPECIISSGKKIINPGETTVLIVKNNKPCRETGVIYGIYNSTDKTFSHKLGYLSHQHHFDSSRFSMQIGQFCGKKCAFLGLNQPLLIMALPTHEVETGLSDSAEVINASQKADSKGYKIIKTASWPTGCIIDSGKAIIYPNEETHYVIKNDKQCNDSGVGNQIYHVEDTKNEKLLGYMSIHRYGDIKFVLQVASFCIQDKCIFKDFNPAQER